eukprot:m.193467 g.193467  ORF g.193467 m.193467 type:complete len:369 (+) comp24981_c2_seq1:54-1160(+)
MSKWLNKKRQTFKEMSNKDAKSTQLEDGFVRLEGETEEVIDALRGFVSKVPSYLHPNPANRLRSGLKKGEAARYKHAVCDIADMCTSHGTSLAECAPESAFGQALLQAGESFGQCRDLQYALDDETNQQFIGPVKEIIERDAKEINYNRKKTRTRRLDYDYKKNTNEDLKTKGKPLKFNDPDMKMAEEKFKESYSKAERSMAALVDGEVENVAQLSQFIQAHQTYFEQCAAVMADAKAQLETIIANGAGREKTKLTINEFNERVTDDALAAIAMPLDTGNYSDDEDSTSGSARGAASPTTRAAFCSSGPRATALFDFDVENDGELGFKEGETIKLTKRIDDNWLEGSTVSSNGSGMFPANYVEVIEEP